jgi:putative addiction module killer protein
MLEAVPLIVYQHTVFREWLRKLRDERARARIEVRVRRLELGNPGDVGSVGEGVMEMRIDYGPGYRVYYVPKGSTIVILLCGGDKADQPKGTKRAKAIVDAALQEVSRGKI